jgi:NAD(P)-dependent dehydrogenase (short-subunit alcohol dehydrogenase family)
MKDRVIVITGASGGFGAALARLAGGRGAHVVLAARRERELGEVAAASGPGALPVVADVTVRADVQRVLDAALARFGRVDAWVNNVGRGITKPVSALTDAEFDEMMIVNVKSALYGMQAVLPHFQAQGRGHVVNVSSMLGRVPFAPQRSAYNAAKHALNALTAGLRMELRGRWPDIHISTVSPGVVATELGVHALGGGPDSRQMPNAQPLEEVAQVIAGLIERPQADVYTRSGMREQVAAYFAAEDMAAAEERFLSAPRAVPGPSAPPRS